MTAPVAGTLEERVHRLESRAAIRELTARYNFGIDDRDLVSVGDLFTETATFRSADGVMTATGRVAICAQFSGRYDVLGPTNHVGHDHVITFEGPRRARGLLSAHAELWRNGRTTVCAMRYRDIYAQCDDGQWRFADRELSFLYYLPLDDYRDGLGQRDRNRAGPSAKAADYPESLATWQASERQKAGG